MFIGAEAVIDRIAEDGIEFGRTVERHALFILNHFVCPLPAEISYNAAEGIIAEPFYLEFGAFCQFAFWRSDGTLRRLGLDFSEPHAELAALVARHARGEMCIDARETMPLFYRALEIWFRHFVWSRELGALVAAGSIDGSLEDQLVETLATIMWSRRHDSTGGT